MIAACRRPGVPIAAVALANKLNANLLRTWVVAEEQAQVKKPASGRTQVAVVMKAPTKPDTATNPRSEKMRAFLSWSGEDFDPNRFDRQASDAALLRLAWNGWGKTRFSG